VGGLLAYHRVTSPQGAGEQPINEEPVDESDQPTDATEPTSNAIRWAAVIGLVVIFVGGIAAFFQIDVCDEKLSSRGSAVEVCRHLNASDPPVIAGFLAIALLSVFFTEISGFGITLRRAVKAANQKAEDAQELSKQNAERVQLAEEHAAEVGKIALEERLEPLQREVSTEGHPAIRELAAEYNRLRLTMPSGDARSAEMNRVGREMIDALRDVTDFNVPEHLQSRDRGVRLAGYAYLRSRPDPRWTTELANSVIDIEDKPFGQYWGLRAVLTQCEADSTALDGETRRRLVDVLQPRIPPGTDRARLLRRLLDTCAT
jgi:hypothetical protein